MSKYQSLTKYLPLFSRDIIGEWVVDTENDGSLEHPIQFPFVRYSSLVEKFIKDVHTCFDQTGLTNYIDVLKIHGIEWNTESMRCADITNLDCEALCALLLGAVRAEKFCDGALLKFFQNGCIEKWLKELQSKAEGKK